MKDYQLEENSQIELDSDISSQYTEEMLKYHDYAIKYKMKATDINVNRENNIYEQINYLQGNIRCFDDIIYNCLHNVNNYKFDSEEDKNKYLHLLENNKMNLLNIEMLDFLHSKVQYRNIYYSYIIFVLAIDMSSFMNFSLKALKSDRMSVAYALLRKPLKENLFFLEWLLVDPDDFFNNVYDSVKKTGNFFSGVKKSKIKAIFNKAFEQVYKYMPTRTDKLLPLFYDEDPAEYKKNRKRIYCTRYDNTNDKSLCYYWNSAIHLCSKSTVGINEFPINEKYNYNEVYEYIELYLEENMYVFPYFHALLELLYDKYYI